MYYFHSTKKKIFRKAKNIKNFKHSYKSEVLNIFKYILSEIINETYKLFYTGDVPRVQLLKMIFLHSELKYFTYVPIWCAKNTDQVINCYNRGKITSDSSSENNRLFYD